jgi:hypothetical protein
MKRGCTITRAEVTAEAWAAKAPNDPSLLRSAAEPGETLAD